MQTVGTKPAEKPSKLERTVKIGAIFVGAVGAVTLVVSALAAGLNWSTYNDKILEVDGNYGEGTTVIYSKADFPFGRTEVSFNGDGSIKISRYSRYPFVGGKISYTDTDGDSTSVEETLKVSKPFMGIGGSDFERYLRAQLPPDDPMLREADWAFREQMERFKSLYQIRMNSL